jgi:hypothetical protein
MAGVQARGLQTLLGYRDARMTMRYSHLSDAYLRSAVNGVLLGKPVSISRPKGLQANDGGERAQMTRG